MRKNSLKVLSMSLLLSSLCIAGCSCDNNKPNVSEIQDGNFLTGLSDDASNLSLLDIYNAVLANDSGNTAVAEMLVDFVASKVLDLKNDEKWQGKYDALVDEKIAELKKDDKYKVNGKYSESLFVLTLQSEGFDVSANNYTDYIEKALRVDILSNLLKQKYIEEVTLKNSKAVVTNKKIREVEYISVSSSIESTYKSYKVDVDGEKEEVKISARDFMREIRNKIVAAAEAKNYDSINFEKYIADEVDGVKYGIKEELKKAVRAEFDKITNAEDYSQELAAKYTANYTRSLKEGLQAELDAVDALEFNFSKVLSADSTSNAVVSDTITSRLLNLSDPETALKRATKIGDWYYLVSLNAGTTVDASDVLLTETTDSSTYTYSIVRFKVINADNYADNKDTVTELLANTSTLANSAVSYYLGKHKNNIVIHDDSIYEYLKTIYPDVFTD